MEPLHQEFIEVYRETVEPLYRYVARRASGSRELAEDVTQETYLRLCTDWRGGRRPDVPLAWLQTVARNLLLNHFRRHPPAIVDGSILDRLTEDEPSEFTAEPGLIQAGLAGLRRSAARLIEAYHLDGKDVRTIAAETGLSERAVEGRLSQARLALRKVLVRLLGKSGDGT